jgi:hypothetical protein
MRGAPLRAPYCTTLIQHCHINEDRPERAAKRKNVNETVIYTRMICTCSLSCIPPTIPKAKEPMIINFDFHQVGVAGPAAYLPNKISVENFVDLSKFRKSVCPTLRPILILCGQVNAIIFLHVILFCPLILFHIQSKEDEIAVSQLSKAMNTSRCMAIIELRSIESSACAASGTTTLFRYFPFST